ncbi:MAG: hypothetical protein IKB56_07760, partial [Clostridia bacterium]|nr:hypothetical protein [Clostridia bacterium]
NLDALNITYDGNKHALALNKTTTQYNENIDSITTVMTDELGQTILGAETAHVGKYTVMVTLNAGPNYQEKTLQAVLTIEKKELTFTWSAEREFVYNKTAQGVTLTITGLVGDDELTLSGLNGTEIITATISGDSQINFKSISASEYSALIDELEHAHDGVGNCHGDYKLPENKGVSYNIYKKAVTINWTTDTLIGDDLPAWEDFKVEYSNVERYVYAEISSGATADDDGKIYDQDDVTVVLSRNSAVEVGDYIAMVESLSGENANNYSFNPGTSKAYSITKTTIKGLVFEDETVKFNGNQFIKSVIGDSTQHGLSVSIEYSGRVVEDYGRSQVSAPEGNKVRNAGKYEITATIAETKNYSAWEKTITFIVEKATISDVSVPNVETIYDNTPKSITLADNFKYGADTDVLKPSYTIYGTKADGTEVVLSVGNSQTDAGVYVVTISIDDDVVENDIKVNANYEDFSITATLTIARATMAFASTSISGGGTFTYNAKPHVVEAVFESVNGENLTQYGHSISVTYSGGENGGNSATHVGEYTINATASAGNNYNETTISTKIIIVTKKITIDWVENDFTYSGVDQSNRITASVIYGASEEDDNKVYDGDAIVLTVKINGENGQNTFFNAGEYNVTVERSNLNYEITNASAVYQMKQAVINWLYLKEEYLSQYDGQFHYVGVSKDETVEIRELVTSVDLKSGDKGTVTYKYNTTGLGNEYDKDFNGVKYAGTYYIQATVSENGVGDNYEDAVLTCKMIIEQASLRDFGFAKEDNSFVYNGTPRTLSIGYGQGNYVNGEYRTQFGDVLTLTYKLDGEVVDLPSAINVKEEDGNVLPYAVTATFTFTGENADALTASYVASTLVYNANLIITKAQLSGIELEGSNTVVYDGNAHILTTTFPANVNGVYPQYVVNGSEVRVILSANHNEG